MDDLVAQLLRDLLSVSSSLPLLVVPIAVALAHCSLARLPYAGELFVNSGRDYPVLRKEGLEYPSDMNLQLGRQLLGGVNLCLPGEVKRVFCYAPA